jgi:hypothetical protein
MVLGNAPNISVIRVEEDEMGWAYGTRRREGGANIV